MCHGSQWDNLSLGMSMSVTPDQHVGAGSEWKHESAMLVNVVSCTFRWNREVHHEIVSPRSGMATFDIDNHGPTLGIETSMNLYKPAG